MNDVRCAHCGLTIRPGGWIHDCWWAYRAALRAYVAAIRELERSCRA